KQALAVDDARSDRPDTPARRSGVRREGDRAADRAGRLAHRVGGRRQPGEWQPHQTHEERNTTLHTISLGPGPVGDEVYSAAHNPDRRRLAARATPAHVAPTPPSPVRA